MSHVRGRLVAGVVAGLALAASVGTATATARPIDSSAGPARHREYVPPPVQWTSCTDGSLYREGAKCGFLVVPLDYANPAGTKIKLALSWIRHRTPDAQAQGLMLVNPG